MSPLEENEEFTNTSGSITFTTGEQTKPIILQAISDRLPEFNEFFVLRLVNISGKKKTRHYKNANSLEEQIFPDIHVSVLKNHSALVYDSLKVVTQGKAGGSRRFSSMPQFASLSTTTLLVSSPSLAATWTKK